MGKILSSKRTNEGIIFEIETEYTEATSLQGHYDSVFLFSENNTQYSTNISSRGKNYSTKYFLIPKNLRHKIDFNSKVNCQKINTKNNIIFIYTVKKK